MNLPKLNALVFCIKAVYTDPWWNLVGEFDDLMLRHSGEAEFDAFMKFGDSPSDRKTEVELRFIEPSTGEIMHRVPAFIYGDSEGVASRAVTVSMTFPREDVYHVEVVIDGHLIDTRKLAIWITE